MKALSKKKYPKKKDAIDRLEAKFGKNKTFKIAKKNKNRWLFNIVSETKEEKPTTTLSWKDFLAQYRAQHKDVPNTEVMKNAGVLYRAHSEVL